MGSKIYLILRSRRRWRLEGRALLAAASSVLAALAVALTLSAETAAGEEPTPLPCATPSPTQSRAAYEEQSRNLPPIALPALPIAISGLELSFRPEPLAVTQSGAIAALAKAARAGDYTTVVCAALAEIPTTVLCLFDDIVTGNLLFYRAASWIEGSRAAPARHFVDGYESYADALKPVPRTVDGFDLFWPDLKAYYDAALAACAQDRAACLNRFESAVFERLLLPLAAERGNFVLLGAGYGRTAIIGHEILHAQYFLFPRYRAVVDCYFDRVLPEAAREEVRRDLGADYDIANPFLMRNEFQAYLLQEGETQHLPRPRRSYRASLIETLRQSGGFPVMPILP